MSRPSSSRDGPSGSRTASVATTSKMRRWPSCRPRCCVAIRLMRCSASSATAHGDLLGAESSGLLELEGSERIRVRATDSHRPPDQDFTNRQWHVVEDEFGDALRSGRHRAVSRDEGEDRACGWSRSADGPRRRDSPHGGRAGRRRRRPLRCARRASAPHRIHRHGSRGPRVVCRGRQRCAHGCRNSCRSRTAAGARGPPADRAEPARRGDPGPHRRAPRTGHDGGGCAGSANGAPARVTPRRARRDHDAPA